MDVLKSEAGEVFWLSCVLYTVARVSGTVIRVPGIQIRALGTVFGVPCIVARVRCAADGTSWNPHSHERAECECPRSAIIIRGVIITMSRDSHLEG